MVTAAFVGNAAPGASRRRLYHQSKRLLVRLLSRRLKGPRDALEPTVRRFLRARPRSYLSRLLGDRGFALAAAASLLAAGTAGALPPIELSDVGAGNGGFVINGVDALDVSGFSVSGAGDVNGDGLADVIVAAWAADPGGNIYAGESYVVFGKADGTAVHLADVAAGSGGFVINGIEPNDRSGVTVSGAGDVNGDGIADLIVGAPGGVFPPSAGKSYVVFGKADTAPVNLSDVAAGSGGFVINGFNQNDRSGVSVSGASDVNGDGLADLIVGAALADAGGNDNAGESYVVFGKADGTAVELADVAAGSGGFVIYGIDAADLSGRSVSGAGDVNGDGLTDLIVGASSADPGGNSNAGESYVVFGKADGTAVNLSEVAAGSGGFVINGIDPTDFSGLSVSGAGDVNGDGLADVIVGAWSANPGANLAAGETYVVFGKADGTAVELSDVAAGSGGFVINGIDPEDFSGLSVSGAGDVNGDGLADLIAGARAADPGGNNSAGESYVVFGKADGTPVNLSAVAAGHGGFVINGIDPDDFSGHSVSDAGDVNGDGLADVIVGAPSASPGGNNLAGESYVVFSPVVRGLVAPLDIEPGDCPNEFKPRLGHSGHKIDIALVGTADFDVTEVDFATILLSRADGVGGAVLPQRVRVKDRATPFDGEPCGCHERKKDSISDLRMRFFAVEMTFELELDLLAEGEALELMVTGELLDGTPFAASDCIVIDDPPGRDDDDSDSDSDEDSSDEDSSEESDDDSDS